MKHRRRREVGHQRGQERTDIVVGPNNKAKGVHDDKCHKVEVGF